VKQTPLMARRMGVVMVSLVGAVGIAIGCGQASAISPTVRPRTYRMGFSNFPPVLTDSAAAANVLMWIQRADAGIIHTNVPGHSYWPELRQIQRYALRSSRS